MGPPLKTTTTDGTTGAGDGGFPPNAAPPGRAHLRSRSWGIAAAYAVFATLWIYFSDHALGLLFTDPQALVRWSVYKGVAFVVVTSVLLLVLIRRAFGRIEYGYAALQAKEAEIVRLNRLYAALSQVNQAIVWMPTRDELFRKVCRVLVEHGGFRLAWIGWHDPGTHRLEPLAVWGDETGSVRGIELRADAGPEGQGAAARAFRENRPSISNDYRQDPAAAAWRDEAGRLGIRASAAFPIRQMGEVAGVLNVFAGESGFFHDREIALLAEAAADIAFALDNFARDAERRQAEAVANREQQFSNAMIESMPGIVYFYDAAGRFLRWNRNFEAVSGYAADEIARMHPLDFFAPEHKPRLEHRIGEVFEKGESSIEAPFLARDGRATPYYFTGRRVRFDGRTCLVGVGIDISERAKAEVALRESEARFHAFMDATPAIAWVTDEDGRHLYMNRAWDEAFGLNRAEWLGKTAFDLVPGPAAERIRRSDAEVLRADRSIEIPEDTGELRGRRFCWNCIKFPFRNAAGQRFIGGIALDITERKALEEQFLRSQRMESVGTLAGGIAHDLNNLLTPILMGVGLLKELELPAESQRVICGIEQAAQRGADLVKQVLSFSRGVEGARVAVHLGHIVREIESIVRNTFPKNIRLEINIPRELRLVMGDPTQLNQVLLNLCVNARDAMPQGGSLTVTVADADVDAQFAAMHRGMVEGRYVLLEVADTGCGMPPEVVERIFEPFYTTKELGKGTGLGLSTTLGIIRSHGGFVNVYSEPGHGSVFRVHLPAQAEGLAPVPVAAPPKALPRGGGECLLVVDDEEPILNVVRQTLETCGYRVFTARDGADAMGLYALHRSEIALVLTDMMMPVMDGATFIAALRHLNPEVRLIATSGFNATGAEVRAAGAGVKHFLTKPYSAERLLTLVKKVLVEKPTPAPPNPRGRYDSQAPFG